MKRSITLLMTATLLFCGVFGQQPAQSRTELEKERDAIQKEIEDVKKSLEETKKNKKETLGQLALLQRRLRLRESAIHNINQQIDIIQSDMNQSIQEISKLRRELDTLRKQYEESVVYAYENRTNYDFLNFIFAASSFNDAIKRVEYLRSYRAYREERAENIKRTQTLLENKVANLRTKRQQKDEVLQKQARERQVLEVEKREKDAVVKGLQSRETELKKEMSAKTRQDRKLGSAIAAVIRRAREEAIREAAKKKESEPRTESPASGSATAKTNPAASLTSPANATAAKSKNVTVFDSRADLALSDNFEKNKGRLPWPMDAGNVSMHYGLRTYVNNIRYNNKFITIEANPGTPVKVVFDGLVQSVFTVGDVTAVVIRHGKYFSTYSNLEGVSVSKNQEVKTGQLLGKISEIGQLEFGLSNDKDQSFDPEIWLRRN